MLIGLVLALPCSCSAGQQHLRGHKVLQAIQDEEQHQLKFQLHEDETDSPARTLTGALEARPESVRATMPTTHPNNIPAVGTPPLQTLQGQALGPSELPVLLPFASPYVSTP